MDMKEMMSAVEAILFVAGDPVEEQDLVRALDVTPLELRAGVDQLMTLYDFERRGLYIERVGESLQMKTRRDFAPYIERMLFPIQKQSLSQSAMETLAIVAYRQPVTRADIESIRGVKSDYSMSQLIQKGLVREVGRKDTLGRPYLYGTTDGFLRHFGITSLNELPDRSVFSIPEELWDMLPLTDTADISPSDDDGQDAEDIKEQDEHTVS